MTNRVLGFIEGIKSVEGGLLRIYGWAKHPHKNVPAQLVEVVDQSNNTIATSIPNKQRVDVQNSYNNPGLLLTGWEVNVDQSKLKGASELHAYAVEGRNRYKLSGIVKPQSNKGTMFAGYHIDTLIKRGLKVGKNFNLQAECFIDFPHCWLITIGDNVTFAPRVHILAHDTSARTFLGHTKVGLVNIGNRVFVGNDAIIMPGVSIGDDVIIGAGSVVTKDVPSGSVYAGNPAKLICTTKEYLNKTKELLGETPVFGSEYTIEKGITEDMKQHMIRRLKESGGVGFI